MGIGGGLDCCNGNYYRRMKWLFGCYYLEVIIKNKWIEFGDLNNDVYVVKIK